MRLVASRRPRSAVTVVALALAVLGGACAAVYHDKHASVAPASSSASPSNERGASDTTPRSLVERRGAAPALRRVYGVRLDQDLVLGKEAGGAKDSSAIRLRLKGDLTLAFVAHASGKHRVFAEMSNVSLDVGDQKTPAEIQNDLQKPFYVVMEPDGRVRGYAFQRGASSIATNILRSVLSTAQVALPAGPEQREWSANEDDIQGSYVARYSLSNTDSRTTIVKTKGAYDRVATMSSVVPVDESGTSVEARMTASAVIADDGWISTLSVTEHRTASLGAGGKDEHHDTRDLPKATTDIRLEMTRLDARATMDPSLLGRFEREDGLYVDAGPFGTGDEAASRRSADERLAGHASFDDLVASSRGLFEDAARGHVRSQLAARMRLASGDCARAADLASKPGTAKDESELLVSALGATGTKESTEALGAVLNAASALVTVRSQAATALAFSHEHAIEAKEPLLRAMNDKSAPPEARQSATLALGAVARDLGDGDTDAVAELVQRYESATTDEERDLYLRALGNSGSIEVLKIARSALASSNATLRGTAAQALRFLPVGEADPLLDRIVQGDPSSAVRVDAIDAIGYRLVEMHAATLTRALDTASGSERGAIATVVRRALGARGKTLAPEARAALTALLQKAETT